MSLWLFLLGALGWAHFMEVKIFYTPGKGAVELWKPQPNRWPDKQEAEPLLLLLLKRIQLEENIASHLQLFRGVIRRLAG